MELTISELRKRAKEGDPDAQFQLGYKHQFGEGLDKNIEFAIYWYKQAIEKNHCSSLVNLAGLYLTRINSKENTPLGIRYLKQAALLGDISSQIQLGMMYMQGLNVEKNRETAKEFFLLAAQLGNAEGQYYFGLLNLQQNPQLAIEWYEKAAEQHFNLALFSLGFLYYEGKLVEKNLAKAFNYYHQAAQHNYAPAMYNISTLLAHGEGTPLDPKQARLWMEKAATQGHPTAQFALASMYYEGSLFPQDLTKAVYWFEKAAEKDVSALYMLGELYYDPGTKKDDEKALSYFFRAAQKGHPLAQFQVAVMYQKGEGTEINLSTAYLWFEIAKISAESAFPAIVEHAEKQLSSLQESLPVETLKEIKKEVNYKVKEIANMQ